MQTNKQTNKLTRVIPIVQLPTTLFLFSWRNIVQRPNQKCKNSKIMSFEKGGEGGEQKRKKERKKKLTKLPYLLPLNKLSSQKHRRMIKKKKEKVVLHTWFIARFG